jgi:hypothetical protein
MVREEFAASLTIMMDPFELPAAVGAKAAVTVRLSEGFSVAGAVLPLVVKPRP